MEIKLNTNISNEYEDIKVTINAPVLDKKVQMLIDAISNISTDVSSITGEADNNIYILQIDNILCFYSDEKYNYCQTLDNKFRIRHTLYELEEILNKRNWIRISNSCIVNLNHIKCFDIGTVGSIVVVLEDGTKKDVSKRKIKEVMNLLKDRRRLV